MSFNPEVNHPISINPSFPGSLSSIRNTLKNNISTLKTEFIEALKAGSLPEIDTIEQAIAILAIINVGNALGDKCSSIREKAFKILKQSDEKVETIAKPLIVTSILSHPQPPEVTSFQKIQAAAFSGDLGILLIEANNISKLNSQEKMSILKQCVNRRNGSIDVLNVILSTLSHDEIKIAAEEFKDSIGNVASKELNFPFKVELAKIAALNDENKQFRNIIKCQFDPKNAEERAALVEIAEISARHGNYGLSACISRLGFDPKDAEQREALIQIAEATARYSKCGPSKEIKQFGFDISDQDDKAILKTIIKQAAAKNSIKTSEDIQNYGFNLKDPEDKAFLIEIAMAAAAQSGEGISYYIKNYGFKTPEDKGILYEIAKAAAAQSGEGFSAYIGNYGFKIPEDKDLLTNLVKIAAAQNAVGVSAHIEKYDFKIPEDKALLVEIVKSAAAQNGGELSKNIPKFGFRLSDDNVDLIEIAKIAAAQDGAGLSKYIKNYGLDIGKNKKELKEIAMIAAAQNGGGCAEHIKNYGFDPKNSEDKAILVEIAKTAAAQDGPGTAKSIKNFGFDLIEDNPAIVEIAKIALKDKQLILTVESLNIFLEAAPESSLRGTIQLFKKHKDIDKFEKEFIKPETVQEQFISSLINKVKNEELNAINKIKKESDGQEISKSKKELIDFNKERSLQLTAYINLLISTSPCQNLDQKLTQWLPTFEELMNVRDPRLRYQLAYHLVSFMEKNPERNVVDLSTAILSHLYEQKGSVNQEDSDFKIVRNLKDANLQKSLLWTLNDLIQDPSVDLSNAKGVLEKILNNNNSTKVKIDQLRLIRALIILNCGTKLKKDADLNTILQARILEEFPSITYTPEDFTNKLNQTFFTYQDPLAIIRYTAVLKKLSDKQVNNHLSTFFTAVLDGKFNEVRQLEEDNPHLQLLSQNHPELLKMWFKGDKKKIDLNKNTVNAPKAADLTAILEKAAAENFFNQDFVSKALKKAPDDRKTLLKDIGEKVKKIRDAQKPLKIQKVKTKEMESELLKLEMEASDLTLASSLIKLLNEKDATAPSFQSLLKQTLKQLKAEDPLAVALKPLEIIEKNKTEQNITVLADTDNPQDIFLCGEVGGSCQAIDGDPAKNQGLLGYLLNSQTRLLTLKRSDNDNSPIAGRAIVRLLFNEKGAPTLLMEPVYPPSLDDSDKQLLRDFACARAETLGIDIVSQEGDSSEPYSGRIISRGGAVPEYVDSAGGIQMGEYSVTGLKKLVKKNLI